MTMTKRILDLLIAGQGLTVKEISALTGANINTVRNVIAEMRVSGYVVSKPATYTITAKGERWQRRVPPVKAPKKPPRIVQTAIQSNRNQLLTAWLQPVEMC